MKLGDAECNQIRHHGILAHGLGVQAIRANTASGTQVGLAENAAVFVPVMETQPHIEAARKATRLGNAQFLTAVMEGKYADEYLQHEGANAPKVEAGDMKAIGSALDFVGLNIYVPLYARADDSPAGTRRGADAEAPSRIWLRRGFRSVRSASTGACAMFAIYGSLRPFTSPRTAHRAMTCSPRQATLKM